MTFTRAQEVAAGQAITSAQFVKLARAFNDRTRSGIGDGAWRLIWFWYNLWRQVRNPNVDSTLFPSQGEFFDIYQHLDEQFHQGATWPEAGPGEAEGSNLANPMMQFVHGIDPTLSNEPERINTLIDALLSYELVNGPLTFATLEDHWILGKIQRGAYDPVTTAQNAPAFDAAQSFLQVNQPTYSPMGKGYGGWLPQPLLLLNHCGSTSQTGLGIPSHEIMFTSLDAGVDTAGLHGTIVTNGDGTKSVKYAGTCPCGTELHVPGHVLGIASYPFAWFVFISTGQISDIPIECSYVVDRIPTAAWIEGPYEGEGRLTHTEGKQVHRGVSFFAADFRGVGDERDPDDFDIEAIAFDFQAFMTRQYALAPNRGHVVGAAVEADYPHAEFAGSASQPAGTFATFTGGGSSHSYADGFVLAGMFLRATKLTAPCTVEFLNNAAVIASLTLTPDLSGDAQAMLWPATSVTPAPLKVRLATAATFVDSTGTIICETNELFEWKPQFWDAYLVTRMQGSFGGGAEGGGVDGGGRKWAAAESISADLFNLGCLPNTRGVRDQGEWVNDNPVYDAARRLCRDQARIVRRQNLMFYEVVDGKSVLYFKRFAFGRADLRADMFKDIAPPLDALVSGGLVEGEGYIVHGSAPLSNSITYRGTVYHNNQTFTATAVKEFTAAGDAQVLVHDGIRHAALKKGFTNEWLMFLQTHCYRTNEESIWKEAAYPDYFTWNNRCHFFSGSAPGDFRRFSSYNYGVALDTDNRPGRVDISLQSQMISPEAPTGYNYADRANTLPDVLTDQFCKSCQIYQAPYEIESCTVHDWTDDQVIKIVLTTRLQSHPDAPAAVNIDPNTWSQTEIEILRGAFADPEVNEDYRTDDNAIREYVLRDIGTLECSFKTGDAGLGSGITGTLQAPFGSCYPHFCFAHLIPEPYEDSDNFIQTHDTRCTVDAFLQMEVAIRSMCEGFVDARTSQDIVCRTGLGNLYDYTFENLCFDAFGGKDIGAFTLAVRSDRPSGFGPLPNTVMYAEVFNRLASAVNLLDKARVDLPIQFKARDTVYGGSSPASLHELDGTGCTTNGLYKAWGDGLSPAGAAFISTGDWYEFLSISGLASSVLSGCPTAMLSTRKNVEYRVEVDPAFAFALPAAIAGLINDGNTGFLALSSTTFSTSRRVVDDTATAQQCPTETPGGFWLEDGHTYSWIGEVTSTEACVLVNAGTLSAPAIPGGDYFLGRSVIMDTGVFCANQESASATLNLIAEQNAFLRVPLV